MAKYIILHDTKLKFNRAFRKTDAQCHGDELDCNGEGSLISLVFVLARILRLER